MPWDYPPIEPSVSAPLMDIEERRKMIEEIKRQHPAPTPGDAFNAAVGGAAQLMAAPYGYISGGTPAGVALPQGMSEEPKAPTQELAAQNPVETSPTAQEEQDPQVQARLDLIRRTLGSMPRMPGIPSMEEGTAAIREGLRGQMEVAQRAEEVSVEHAAKVDAELRSGQAAITDMQRQVDEERKAIDIAIDDRIMMQEYPNAPTPDAVRSNKMYLEHPEKFSPDQVAAAQKELDSWRMQGGTAKVMGPWYKTLMVALTMGMGAFGSALTGQPNYAMQIINGAIDRAQREEETKAARLDKIMAARGQRAELQLTRTKEDFLRRQQERAYVLELFKVGLEGEMAKITSAEKQAAAQTVYGQVLNQIEQTKSNVAMQRATLQMQGAIARQRLAEKRLAAEDKLQQSILKDIYKGKSVAEMINIAKESFEGISTERAIGKAVVPTAIGKKFVGGPAEVWDNAHREALGVAIMRTALPGVRINEYIMKAFVDAMPQSSDKLYPDRVEYKWKLLKRLINGMARAYGHEWEKGGFEVPGGSGVGVEEEEELEGPPAPTFPRTGPAR